ncbi:MAG: DUF3794 domain-containing protein [Eubacteriales bacterium]|nr:DUF3794 domain-containing protein [Eubacteriales bacterium]
MKFDIKSVFLPEITVNDTFTKDMELDGALPEFAPDISKLVRIDAKIRKPDINIAAGKADMSCKVDFGILYESDYKSRLAYVEIPGTLNQKADCPDVTREYYATAAVNCAYLTCKLLGPRKFVIRAKMNTDMAITEIRELKAVDPDSSQVSAFFLTQKLTAKSPCGTYYENYNFSETVPIELAVDNVVYVEGVAGAPEVQVAEGRLTVKSNIAFKTLFLTEDGCYGLKTHVNPVTLTLDNDNISPNQTFSVYLRIDEADAVPEADDYGDNKLLKINYTVAMTAICFEDSEETVATDGFCGDRDSQCVVTPASYRSLTGITGKTFSFDKTHDTEKTDIRELLDTSVSFTVTEKTVRDGALNIKGNVDIEVLARTDSGIISEDFGGEFDESIVLESAGDTVTDVSLWAVDVTSNVYGGENIAVRTLVYVKANVYSSPVTPVLTEFSAEDGVKTTDGSIRFYYPEKTETAWSVAKKYNKNPKKLIDDNRNMFEADGKLKDSAIFVAVK